MPANDNRYDDYLLIEPPPEMAARVALEQAADVLQGLHADGSYFLTIAKTSAEGGLAFCAIEKISGKSYRLWPPDPGWPPPEND